MALQLGSVARSWLCVSCFATITIMATLLMVTVPVLRLSFLETRVSRSQSVGILKISSKASH